MIVGGFFGFFAYFRRLPPSRAYMAAFEVLDEDGEAYYWPSGQTAAASAGGTLKHIVDLETLQGSGGYEVYGLRGMLRELDENDWTVPALDLDGVPLRFGPYDLYREPS